MQWLLLDRVLVIIAGDEPEFVALPVKLDTFA